MSVSSYRDLTVWQAAIDFASEIYRLTATFPKGEVYGLTAQLRRSTVSIASNIAEGHARGSTKEYQRFIGIARGSLAEAETQLLLSERLEFVSSASVAEMLEQADHISRMLRRLDQALQRRAA